jgi:hypothetical protein
VQKTKLAAPAVDQAFVSYVQLAQSLRKDIEGICLLDDKLQSRGHAATLRPEAIAKWLRALNWEGTPERDPAAMALGGDHWLTAVALQQSDGTLLGVFCVRQILTKAPMQPARHAREVAQQLKPLLDCVHRDLAAAQPKHSLLQTLTERTAELEWLFKVTSTVNGATDDRRLLEDLLSAATERLDCVYGVIAIPEKRLCVEHERAKPGAGLMRDVWKNTQDHLIAWAQRQRQPLLINSAGRSSKKFAPCKILSVPVVRDTGRVLGVLVFYNPPNAPDFQSRHVFLARHLGKQTAHLVDAQFDLMTGLYTRAGIEQMYTRLPEEARVESRSIVYIDIDHMHVINELHGFELGNELIVRIADLLAPPLLPVGAGGGVGVATFRRSVRDHFAGGRSARSQYHCREYSKRGDEPRDRAAAESRRRIDQLRRGSTR